MNAPSVLTTAMATLIAPTLLEDLRKTTFYVQHSRSLWN